MIKYFCDRCGKEIEILDKDKDCPKIFQMRTGVYYPRAHSRRFERKSTKVLCKDCQNYLAKCWDYKEEDD